MQQHCCSIPECDNQATIKCGRCQDLLCNARYCDFSHSSICGKYKPVVQQQQDVASQMPIEVHSAIETYTMKRQDKLLMQVASAARDSGDATLATMAVNAHLSVNAYIGNAIQSGYQVGAQATAHDLWGEILDRIAVKSTKDTVVQDFVVKVAHALQQPIATNYPNTALALASETAVAAATGNKASIYAIASQYSNGVEIMEELIGNRSDREEKKYLKKIRPMTTKALLAMASQLIEKLDATAAKKGVKGVFSKLSGERGKNKGRLKAVVTVLSERVREMPETEKAAAEEVLAQAAAATA